MEHGRCPRSAPARAGCSAPPWSCRSRISPTSASVSPRRMVKLTRRPPRAPGPTDAAQQPLADREELAQPAHLQDGVVDHGAPPCRKQRTWRAAHRAPSGGRGVRHGSPIDLAAARMIGAARRPGPGMRDRSGDGRQPRARLGQHGRDRAQQRPRVGVLRRGEDVRRPARIRRRGRDTSPPRRCAISAITPMSWVIRMIARPRLACNSRSRSRICACVVTSSAVVGSSAIRMRGSHASAMAIITRWRRPPESWNGYSSTRRAGCGTPTMSSSSIARARAARRSSVHVQPDRLDDLVADGVGLAERGHRLLEHQRDLAAADGAVARRCRAPAWPGRPPRPSGVRSRISPATTRPGRSTMPQHAARGDALAAAAFADDAERAALEHVEIEPVDRPDDALGREELRLQLAHREQCLSHRDPPRRAAHRRGS